MAEHIVIVGAGQAASSLVARLRNNGHDGRITLIGGEPAAPYQRPPLSKAYLLGQMDVDRLELRSRDWWAEQNVDLRLAQQVTAIDRTARMIRTETAQISYDQLVLATGASPRRLPDALGGNLAGIHAIRDLADVDRLQPELAAAQRLVVVGGGYIGLEAAAVARTLGKEVTLIEAAPRILGRVAAAPTASLVRALHEKHGVIIREACSLKRLTGEGRVDGVELADGTTLPADLVILGIGVSPRTELAEAAGLAIDNGIAVDQHGRSTDPRIWAVGDCASFPWQGERLRIESVGNAIDMAELVADNISGTPRSYEPKPWFWSDQFSSKLQIAGLNQGYDQTVERAGEGAHAGSVWYYRAGRLIAVDALNDARAYMVGKRLIDAGRSADPARVADSAIPVKDLLA